MTKVTVSQMDAQDFMATLKGHSVDVLVTDPPYWTLDRWRNVGTTTRLGGHSDKDSQRPEMFFETISYDYLWEWFSQLFRVLKKDAHAYIFCDDIVAPILLNWIREGETGFEDAHQLIWDKESIGMGYHYRHQYECIVFAWMKGKRKLRDLGKSDILRQKRVVNGYPTEKPAPLVYSLLLQSARTGDTICDPFAGSGVVAASARFEDDLTVLLNDKSDAAIAHMKQRFGDTVLFRLPMTVKWEIPDGKLAG